MTGRDWPPAPKPDPTPIHPEAWLGMVLFLVAPLSAWLVAALPGQHPFAPVLWPAGWIVAVVVALGGAYLRGRRSE